MATAILQAPSAPTNRYPEDYHDLVDELHEAQTNDELRRWTLSTTARRAALPREAQAQLRDLTLHQQQRLRSGAAGEPAERAARIVAAHRDRADITDVRDRLMLTLNACAHLVTHGQYEQFADAIHAVAAANMTALVAADATGRIH